MPGLLSSGFLWSRWRGQRSRHSWRMRNSQFRVSCKRPMWRHPNHAGSVLYFPRTKPVVYLVVRFVPSISTDYIHILQGYFTDTGESHTGPSAIEIKWKHKDKLSKKENRTQFNHVHLEWDAPSVLCLLKKNIVFLIMLVFIKICPYISNICTLNEV